MSQNINNGEHRTEYQSDIFTARCVFLYKGIQTEVNNPIFYIKDVDKKQEYPLNCFDSMPVNPTRTRWQLNQQGNQYFVDIDPLVLPPSYYNVFFEGQIQESGETKTLIVQGNIEIGVLNRMQMITNTVLRLLSDDYYSQFLMLPDYISNVKVSNIMSYIDLGIKWINSQGAMRTSFTVDTLPPEYEPFLIDYVLSRLFLNRAKMSIDTDLQINDSHSLNQQKYSKYQQMFTALLTNAQTNVVSTKRARPAGSKGAIRNPYAFNYYGVRYGRMLFSSMTNTFLGTMSGI